MTCGKSTIGPILANTLGWNYYDLDDVIEEKESKTIVEIFESDGEEYFRNLETKTLEEISKEDNVIISLGGGTLTNKKNLDIMREHGKIIYLKTNTESIYFRIRYKTNRPLFRDLVIKNATKEDFLERIENVLKEREFYYKQADYTFDTSKTSVGITVDKIAKLLRKLI